MQEKKIKNGFDPETHKLTSYMHAGNSHTDVEGDYHIRKRSRLGQRLHVLYTERGQCTNNLEFFERANRQRMSFILNFWDALDKFLRQKKCFINAVNMELGETVFSYVDIS